MDQKTHDIRLANWKTIINNCEDRPEGQSKRQWLTEHNVPMKSYYYWQRKIRIQESSELQPVSKMQNEGQLSFVELPFCTPEETTSVTSAPAVIHRAGMKIELNNSIDDHLLMRILEAVSHA